MNAFIHSFIITKLVIKPQVKPNIPCVKLPPTPPTHAHTPAGVQHVFIMGDVTFGACCIDDLSAAAVGCDLLIHYGHSCLVPVDVTSMPCLYVFVDISIDLDHLVACVKLNFRPGTRLVLAGAARCLQGSVSVWGEGGTQFGRRSQARLAERRWVEGSEGDHQILLTFGLKLRCSSATGAFWDLDLDLDWPPSRSAAQP